MKSSPAEVLESSPPPEMPRTPSPTSPPIYSSQSPIFDPMSMYDNTAMLSKGTLNSGLHNHSDGGRSRKSLNIERRDSHDEYDLVTNDMIGNDERDPFSHLSNRHEPKIPLKYQRQSKSSQKPYKKKFRTWGYEDDVGSGVGNDNDLDDFNDSRDMQYGSHHHHHKASKFRPKGKDYDWRNHENDAHV